MTYFHTGIRTIIGAEVFHGPVRDGKEWDHLAMVVRLKLCCLGAAEVSFKAAQVQAQICRVEDYSMISGTQASFMPIFISAFNH